MLFRYKALSSSGKTISGVIDADTYILAKEKLSKQQILITALSPIEKTKRQLCLTASQLLAFTRELGQLLRAGLPLYESLLTIEEKYRGTRIHPLFLDLCDKLKAGASLSSALKFYPKSFDKVYLAMVQAAEESASLPYVFDQLAMLIARQEKLKKQLFSALAYPAFLGCFCLCVVASFLFFVIPSIAQLFENREVHPLTKLVLASSKFANTYGLHLLISLLGISSLLFLCLKQAPLKHFIERLLLKTPILKKVLTQTALTRFCRATSILLLGGVPLLETLVLSRKVMKNGSLEEVVAQAEAVIVEGKPLSSALNRSSLIPPLVTRMIAIAEETGKMGVMLQHLADIYDENIERDLNSITSFLQPALLLLLGAVVGLVVLSILLPLTDVSSFISN